MGADVQGVGGLDVVSGKLVLRFAFSEFGRLDAGFGAGNVRDGNLGPKHTSAGGDLGLLFGWPMRSKGCTLYAGAKGAWAQSPGAPEVTYLFGVVGASLRNTPRSRVIIEGALGSIRTQGADAAGLGLYLGIGLQRAMPGRLDARR